MIAMLCAGEKVRHNKMAEWGVGKILEVNSCGTISVMFEGKRQVSIAKGAKFLVRASEKEKTKTAPKKS
ncbi:DUF3553 domain-containing protein [Desulfopila inferna]|uniref:DUF3553 domain-containing protein n=1 Tax=Desulfopila inferna TaxID=468528 RepID=UPI0019627783|nr:DUF3553 domain-containing protein [Desulfopila inferna]MBM9606097.1 DUF3553 domain-containing protein [Desulfopila inferna]